MTACITAALTIISLILEMVAQRKTAKEANSGDTNSQEMRKDLSENDADDMSARLADQHDRVSAALCGDSAGGDDPGKQDADRPALPGQRAAAEIIGDVS